MNKKLIDILEQLVDKVYCTMCGTQNDNPKQIKIAHDQIIELWKECLPKKEANTEVSEYYSGFNKAITQAQKNMEG